MAETTSTPNLYILLGLNPDDPWDKNHALDVLEEKRSEWSRKSNGVGNAMLEAKRNLALVSRLRDIITDPDPTERKHLADVAKQERAAGSKAKIDLFERQLDILLGKGFLEQNELDKLITDFKDVLSEKEIRRRITVPIRPVGAQGPKEQQQLDPTMVKSINDKLQLLQKQDLYDLLGLPDTTSNEELSRAAQALYEDMQRRQPKTTEVTMQSELAGYAKTIFKSKEMRAKYNESRRLSKFNALLEEFEKIVNMGAAGNKAKMLYAGQVVKFLERAARDGWSEQEARDRLSEHAKKRSWMLEVPTIDINAEKQRCGFCKTINEKNHKYCTGCNRELQATCPDCGRTARSDDVGCVSCGFAIGNRYLVDDLLGSAKNFLSQHDLQNAERELRNAEEAWQPKKKDARLQHIQELRAEVARTMQAQQKSVEQLKHYISARQFYTARDHLLQQRADAIPDRESYLQTINTELAQAQNLLKQAKATNNADQKIELCLQALRSCTDYKDARDLLSTVPPSPPGNLQAKKGGSSVSLQWTPSPTRNVSYKIVRKTRAQPVSVKDGVVLATVAGRVYEDEHPEIGISTFYAVFAALEDITSVDAAALARPVMIIEDVKDVKARIDNNLIELSWQAPPNVQNIIVVRKQQTAPTSMRDGTQISALDSTRVVDRAVHNGTRYFYNIYCQFRDYDGQPVTSPGVTSSATPEPPPDIISSLDISSTPAGQGYEVLIRWSPPAKGDAVILKSQGDPDLRPGETVPRAALTRYGTLLQQRPNSCTDSWSQPGVAYYTPVVLFQNMAYVGTPQRYAVVDDVKNLTYQNLGSAIRLNWAWPANCQEVLVTYDYRGWPQITNNSPNLSKVTRAEYEYKGYYDIRGTQNCDYYIVVAAVIRQNADQIIGSGARIQARLASKIIITYEIKMPRSLFGPKKRLLHISARSAGSLPTLVIVSKQGRLPLRKEEGEPIFRLEGPVPIEGELEYELPDRSFGPRTFGKLYLEDDRMYEVVTIHHPSEEKLRLV